MGLGNRGCTDTKVIVAGEKVSSWFPGSQSETWLSLLSQGSEGKTILDFEGNQSFFLTLGSRRNF